MTDTVQNFFTFASLGTFAGASASVIVVSNTIRKLFNLDSPWPAFITALIVTSTGAYSANSIKTFMDVVLILLNTCLLFSSAAGIQETAISVLQPKPAGQAMLQGKTQVKWLSSWLR